MTRSVTLNEVKGLAGIRYEILRYAQDDLSGQIATLPTVARNDISLVPWCLSGNEKQEVKNG